MGDLTEFVSGLENFLRTPPNSWRISYRSQNGLSYRVERYIISVEFLNKEEYQINIQGEKELKRRLILEYLRNGNPNWEKFFETNIELIKELPNCK